MRNRTLCVGLGAAVLVLAGCHRDGPMPTQAGGSSSAPAASVPVPRDRAVVYVVNPRATGDQDPLMPRTIALHHSVSPVRDAVSALLQAKGSPLEAGTALRGITIDNGVATLDFSRSPINETGGEGGQGDALAALSRTLGQFPEIRQYRIEAQGKPLASLGEQGAQDGPMDVIRPDSPPQVKGSNP